jgi:DMSO/TMAO reductase YedYZ molybdopterin-dependent catalytic subunit
VVPFTDEGQVPLETLVNEGWDGRLYTDLSRLEPGALITPNERFYVRTRYPDLLDADAPWSVAVDGLVDEEQTLPLEELLPLAAPRGVHLMECSGNSDGGSFGLMSAASWDGVAMSDVLALVAARPEATRVLVSGFDGHSVPSNNGHSKPGASWIFTFDQLQGAFLATGMNGAPLPPDHGAPLRLLMPGWYGCTCIKWVDRITLVDDEAPATAQMQEFASRTHQDGVPARAADYRPANIEQAAMPIRVERWEVEGRSVLRIVGILWGGSVPTDALSIRVGDGDWTPVDVCPRTTTNATWTLWSHAWHFASLGAPRERSIRLRIDDASIPTRRLDADWYLRSIVV